MTLTRLEQGQNSRRAKRRGFTLVEVVVAMPIILVAAGLLMSTLTAATRQRTINAENARAAEALRSCLETMRNEDFAQLLVLFDADPMNDPIGPGTAPGNRFPIAGLAPLAEAADGFCGEILLPLVDVAPPGSVLPSLALREDTDDPALGLPRDLSGDHVVDALDHSGDFEILPVIVQARWQGTFGPRSLRMFTLFTEFTY